MSDYKADARASRGAKMAKYADGGAVPKAGDFWDVDGARDDLSSAMHTERARNEREGGEHFFDNGSRIPGRQKGLNDAYTDRLRRRK